MLGKITSAYGIKGWVKVYSETDPRQGILDYQPWFIKTRNHDWTPVKLTAGKIHGKGLVVQIEGSTNRDLAAQYCGAMIAVEKASLPALEEDDYYWHQLEGLRVVTKTETTEALLGRLDHLMATGANDVMVIKHCEGSLDQRERLIPYLPDQVVKNVDLEKGEIRVVWDPEF